MRRRVRRSAQPLGVTMRTPRYIANVSIGVLVLTVLAARILVDLVDSSRGEAFLVTLGQAALGSVLLGAFAWLGTYLGARFSAPYQRSDRLIRVVSLTFIAFGVLLSLPIKTHAIKIDMPSASHASSGVDWSALLLPLGLLGLLVLIPFAVTRGLAIVLAKVAQP
jgi:hypothetical protein